MFILIIPATGGDCSTYGTTNDNILSLEGFKRPTSAVDAPFISCPFPENCPACHTNCTVFEGISPDTCYDPSCNSAGGLTGPLNTYCPPGYEVSGSTCQTCPTGLCYSTHIIRSFSL